MTSRNPATRLKRVVDRTEKTAEWYAHLTVDELLAVVDALACALPAGLKREAVLSQVAMMAETADVVVPLIEAMFEDGYGPAITALVERSFFVPWPLVKGALGDPNDEDSGATALLEVGLAVIVNLDGEGGLAAPPCLHPHLQAAVARRAAAASSTMPKAPAPAPAAAKAAKAPTTSTSKTSRRVAAEVAPASVAAPTESAAAAPSPKATVVRRAAGSAPPAPTPMPAPLPEPPVYVPPPRPAPPPVAPRVVTPPKATPRPAFASPTPEPPKPKKGPSPPPEPTRTNVTVGPALNDLAATLKPSTAGWELAVRLWELPSGDTLAVAVVVDTVYGRLQGMATDPEHTDVAAGFAVADAIRSKGLLPATLRVETQTLKRVVRPMLDALVVQVGRPGSATRKVAGAHRPAGAI